MTVPEQRKTSSISRLSLSCILGFAVFFYTCSDSKKPSIPKDFVRTIIDSNPPVTPLSPEKSIELIQLPQGFHVELVASEPMIQEPVAITWDANGKMYVAEMNTYMKDANASGEYVASSRIKLLEDTDRDGKMDRYSIFADSLLLPRATWLLAISYWCRKQIASIFLVSATRMGMGKRMIKKSCLGTTCWIRETWNIRTERFTGIWIIGFIQPATTSGINIKMVR